ncbi:helix-turn-helix domain-containing protein [Streptomyces massasporeus]|uniref:Helix-turn-helix domain-containing protein n=1 Tax=Streptomyces massasporeus TaxID=67324 RepID=A0ABW6L6V4_9ACTN
MPRPTPPDARPIARRRQVGERIRRVREQHDLTQLEACARYGVDVATYSRIEQATPPSWTPSSGLPTPSAWSARTREVSGPGAPVVTPAGAAGSARM